jgi:hypothetical protein
VTGIWVVSFWARVVVQNQKKILCVAVGISLCVTCSNNFDTFRFR